MKLITLDFETLPIGLRPARYPPEPVSFSVKLPEWRAPRFFAWGHKVGPNTTSRTDAARVLEEVWRRVGEETHLLCHNAKFDLEVAEAHFGLQMPPWHQWHDTMFLLFLHDPHQRELGLKPSAERLLGMKAEERDAVKEWVLEHKRQLESEFPGLAGAEGSIKPSNAGAFVAYAPISVVEPYANGDVTRAERLFKRLYPEIKARGMLPAYDRERRLMPILLRNEQEGIKVDTTRLTEDEPEFAAAQAKADAWLRKRLKAPDLDFDKDADVALALDKAGVVTQWTRTKTGRLSVSKKNLKLSHFRDPKVAAAYSYRQKCATALETFIRPWLRYSEGDGRMRTSWNQVRQAKGGMGDTGGTRTGRPSSDTPNFLNMPKKTAESELTGFLMPKHIPGLPELPKIRSYIIPSRKGWVIGRRDFNQQELRVLAHFEDGVKGGGALLREYLKNPRLDVHEYLRQQIVDTLGIPIDRYTTKTLNFGYVYGQGQGSLAERLERTVQEVKQFRDAQMRVLPGLKALSTEIKERVAADEPIVTWGGRQYYVEPPRYSEEQGRWLDFTYKLLNYLIQGSSADITKESIIRYHEVQREGRFILTVYDENDIEVHARAAKAEMLRLREAMMSIELDVPLLSDGELGPTLGDLEDLVEPAPDLSRWGIAHA